MPTRLEDLYRDERPPARARPVSRPENRPMMSRIFSSLLDPVILQRLLILGGGLIVVGLLITLASQGIFDNPLIAASTMTIGSLLVIAGGWGTILRTKHTIAGIAFTFLGCVVLPLNLWFYHVQNLIRVDQHLWVCGLACVAVYTATVYRLRKPVFLYAVQLGVLLTTLLLLGKADCWNHLNWISTVFILAGTTTLYLPFALPDDETTTFSRKRFGRPLVIGGHIQLALGLIILSFVQLFGYQFAVNEYVLHAGIQWKESIVWLSSLWTIGSIAYLGLVRFRKQSMCIIPAVICLVAMTFEWLEIANWEAPWRLLAISGLGSVLLVCSRFVKESKEEFSLRQMLETVGMMIVMLCLLGMAMRAVMMMGTVEPLMTKILPILVGSVIPFALLPFVSKNGRTALFITGILEILLIGFIVSFHSQLPIARKVEFLTVASGMLLLGIGTIRQLKEPEDRPEVENTLILWFGSLCLGITLLVWGLMGRFHHELSSTWDEPVLLIGSMLLIVTGIISQVKASTIAGITALTAYIVTLVVTLLHAADLAAGIYLGAGGGIIFGIAIVLSVLREKLLHIPEKINKREGVFQFLNWR